MSAVLSVIIVVFDLILPIALLLWALKTRAKSRLYLASIWLSTAVVIAVLAKSIVGFWYVVGVFWPAVYLVALAAILIVRMRRSLPAVWLPRRWSREFFVTVANILHAGLWALMIPQLLQARSYEGTALDLSPPLRGGQFYVLFGGANASVNQHSDYALDIGKLNALGLVAAGFFPQDLHRTRSQAIARPALPAIQPGPDRREPLVPNARGQRLQQIEQPRLAAHRSTGPQL